MHISIYISKMCIYLALTTLLLLAILSGCKKSYSDKVSGIETYFAKGKTGDAPDYFLINNTELVGQVKVAVIFGLIDNREFCSKIAELYMREYTLSHYFCIPANK